MSRVDPLSVFEAAREAPRAIALMDANETLTFESLAERVAGAISWLKAQGIGERRSASPVALVGTLSLDTVIMVLSLVELGVPAMMLHPKLTRVEREALLKLHGPRLFVSEDNWAPTEAPQTTWEKVARNIEPISVDRPLSLLFTSGTEGQPKGVVLSRRAWLAAAEANRLHVGWKPDDRWLLCLTPAHAAGLSVLIRCLTARRTVVLSGAGRFDAAALAEAIERQRVTLISLVPTMLAQLLDLDPSWNPPPHLRVILLGGAPASPRLLSRARDRGAPVLTSYGLTETCGQIVTQDTEAPAGQAVGKPLHGVQLRIVDGEIQVRGPMLMDRYAGPGTRLREFVEGGWFRTGDLGMLDRDGRLRVLGRRDDRILTGGENVDPLEVEQALEQIPGVKEACAFGVRDEHWGQVVAAAIVLADGSRADDVTLEPEIAGLLATYKRPRKLTFVRELPRTPAGKLDRAAMRRASQ